VGKNASALAYCISTSTTRQAQTISFTKEIHELLRCDFDQAKIKNYKFWFEMVTNLHMNLVWQISIYEDTILLIS